MSDIAYIKTETASDGLKDAIRETLEDAGFEVDELSLGGLAVEASQ